MERKKIAILGGGIAALSAAFELTELDPDHQLFDITIYTIGPAPGRKRSCWPQRRGRLPGGRTWTACLDRLL